MKGHSLFLMRTMRYVATNNKALMYKRLLCVSVSLITRCNGCRQLSFRGGLITFKKQSQTSLWPTMETSLIGKPISCFCKSQLLTLKVKWVEYITGSGCSEHFIIFKSLVSLQLKQKWPKHQFFVTLVPGDNKQLQHNDEAVNSELFKLLIILDIQYLFLFCLLYWLLFLILHLSSYCFSLGLSLRFGLPSMDWACTGRSVSRKITRESTRPVRPSTWIV